MPSLQIGSHLLEWGAQTYVMGILNLTPDSFSGDGLLAPSSTEGADPLRISLDQARRFVEAGALLLDVGGEVDPPRLSAARGGRRTPASDPDHQSPCQRIP